MNYYLLLVNTAIQMECSSIFMWFNNFFLGKPAIVGGGVGVTQEEYKALLYVPKKTEWPSCGREADSQRLIRGLEALMQHSVAEPFIAPVDLQQFPTYACFVSYPIDLSTIKTRLENGFYRLVWLASCKYLELKPI